MSLFGFGKKNDSGKAAPTKLSREEQYGKAWLLIVGQKQKEQGLKMMRALDENGWSEAAVVLGMFASNDAERARIVRRAADAGNPEGLWEYSGFLQHAFCPDMKNRNDKVWVETVLKAAELGSVDAMNEMGYTGPQKSDHRLVKNCEHGRIQSKSKRRRIHHGTRKIHSSIQDQNRS